MRVVLFLCDTYYLSGLPKCGLDICGVYERHTFSCQLSFCVVIYTTVMSCMPYVIVGCLALCLATSFSTSTEYCVVITESVQEDQNCHNLSYYAENSQLLSNQHRVELQFVNIGQYKLHTDLVIENVTYVSIVGKNQLR